jgi:hypothetical protein
MEKAMDGITTDALKDSAYIRSQVKSKVDSMLREFVPEEDEDDTPLTFAPLKGSY